MRVLLGETGALSEPPELPDLYAVPDHPWLRVTMVSTVDGAATGDDGTSRSINNGADKRVFDLLRDLADAIVVGAGTVRVEGYAVGRKPLVVVSRTASVPVTQRPAERGQVLMATVSTAPYLREARALLGEENVLVLGSHRVDLARLKDELVLRGYRHLLSEGGPHLLRDLLDQGVVDELDATIVPRLVGGAHRRITDGPPVDVPLRLHTLVEEEGTLLARWLVER
ncbi:MAG TPA: dihydrofolate reductase family protein [Nocardioides sp.]|jgi:riboflavin biosynthesis pyrimidine reductase|uniref:dihydrofolate reductase family protein n=1 Tax=Nocardioides sp. TaxID=35761 RepID=UPI002E2FB138|nr:dihydrofolate reductase family protein [Nocardioides sp.]HEX3932705.1 dihydrofolate reductase family protein [Nocardioides sp.]